MFYSARGVPQDYVAAANWFHRAAEQGDAFAQHSLATQYRMGQGVPQNSATAVDWYRRAAEQGHADAQFDLGVCYVEGNGVSVDMLEAYIWFDLAARHYPPGKDRQDALTARQDTSRNLTRAQRATAKRRAGERSSKGA
jgi:TPR repeat protein